MSSTKPAFTRPDGDSVSNNADEISFQNDDGQNFVAWKFDKKIYERAGPPSHHGNMKIIRTAVMAESFLAIEKLIRVETQ